MLRGIYLEPSAVVTHPDYAAKLVDAGVSIFLMRTGFDSGKPASELEHAVTIATKLGVSIWFLVGTWWGQGITEDSESMSLLPAWRILSRRQLLGNYPAHEEQWPMRVPGGSKDNTLCSDLEKLVQRWGPHGICLTHARFRHPASIAGLFETAPSWHSPLQSRDWELVITGLRNIKPKKFLNLCEQFELIEVLDYLAIIGGSKSGAYPFSAWFALREQHLRIAVQRLVETVRQASSSETFVGTNAIAPHAAVLSGQDYKWLSKSVDFVQPLFGYMNWHVFQCCAAWARLVQRFVPNLTEASAIAGSWKLFGFDQSFLPQNEKQMNGEGESEIIENIVGILLRNTLEKLSKNSVMPVLRGHQWPFQIIEKLEKSIRTAGCPAIFYQGTQFLAGPAPGPGWQ